MITLPTQLQEISDKISRGELPDLVTVRTLIGWFGYKRRTWYVTESINKVLDALELRTQPDFGSAFIDAEIHFEKIEIEEPITGDDIAEEFFDQDWLNSLWEPEEMKVSLDPTFRISRFETANLESVNKVLISVNPDSEWKEAVIKMVMHDFSQLPVLQSKREIKGVISWKSIAIKLAFGKTSLKVRDLMETSFQIIPINTSLFKAVPLIIEHDYVLVHNNSKEICGIVTASDLSLQFKLLTEPFLLVGEIERYVRKILSVLDLQDIASAKDEKDSERVINGVDDLTFGEYFHLCENPEKWDKLQLPVDRKTFCESLKNIASIRNNIMHFEPDGLAEEELDILRNFTRLLQTLRNEGIIKFDGDQRE